MTKATDTDAANPHAQLESGITRRDVVTGGAAGLGAAALLGTTEARSATTRDPLGSRVRRRRGRRRLRRAHGGDPRPRCSAPSVLVVEAAFDVGGRMLHSGSFVSLGAGDPGAATRHARRARRRRAHQGRSDRGPGRARRQRRAVVHGPHGLVDRRPSRLQPVPLQRARTRPRLGRELPGHPAVPDGQLRALRAHQRHALGRRHVARARRRLLPHARRQDGHEGRHGHGRGCGPGRSRALERIRPGADGQREPRRRARRVQQRRRARAAARVLGAREGRASSC